MLYVQVVRSFGKIVAAVVVNPENSDTHAADVETRNDWKTFEAAQEVAAALGKAYIATDAGSHVSPRYDVQELPKIGDDVSKGFNGDYYLCGKITKISTGPAFRRIETSEGEVFWRVKQSGCWKSGGTWSLVAGSIVRRNPEF